MMESEPDKALALSEYALAAHERILGPAHPWTKESAYTTAYALHTLGRGEKSATLFKKYAIESR